MGYHDVQLPTKFSRGSLFGPGYETRIIELDSKAEHRIQRGPEAGRRSYSLSRGVDSIDSLLELYEFFIARQGAYNSFRLKDWLDYATNSTGTTHRGSDPAVAYTDETLDAVDGSTTVFQLVKRYTSGPTTVKRKIKKPVADTVKVGDATGEIVSGFTVDYQEGTVTFDVAPTGTVTGGCEFDTVARFAEETDKNFLIAIDAVESGDLPEIRCVEDVDPVSVSQDFPFGGAYDHGVIAANVSVSELNGRVQRVAPTTAGRKLILPLVTNLPLGGPYFFFINDGTQSVAVESSTGGAVVTLAAGGRKEIWLGLSGSTKTWFAL